MKYLVTAGEMRQYDENTIRTTGIPGMVLMERAALSALEEINKAMSATIENAACNSCTNGRTALVMAGVGNNGGDGLALARMLSEEGYLVSVWIVGDEKKATQQWKLQMDILKHFPIQILPKMLFSNSEMENSAGLRNLGGIFQREEYTVLIDALFGIGLTRKVTGEFAKAINRFNCLSGYKVALDVPSGLNADNGTIEGVCVRADLTVSFGFCKRGLVFYPGCEYAGRVAVTRMGIGEQSFLGRKPEMFYLDETIHDLLPLRQKWGNKGTFGKVVLVAGCKNMAGAAVLAAKACYRAGAGMVKVITPMENRVILQTAVPEALLGTPDELRDSLDWADVIAVGPGLGQSEEALTCLKMVLQESEKPLLIDGDGLNLLAKRKDLQKNLSERNRRVVLTPHVGELSRLMELTIAQLKESLWEYGKECARRLHAVVVAKDARTFICREKGATCVNLRGNSGMATAGSGDVLAGLIAGLMAQQEDDFKSACTGVAFHGQLGDRKVEETGEHGLMAGDLLV